MTTPPAPRRPPRGYGSGSLREIRPGVWQLRFAGRSRTVHGGRKEAERPLATIVSTTTETRRPETLGVTLGALLTQWLTTARIENSTRTTYTVTDLPVRLMVIISIIPAPE